MYTGISFGYERRRHVGGRHIKQPVEKRLLYSNSSVEDAGELVFITNRIPQNHNAQIERRGYILFTFNI